MAKTKPAPDYSRFAEVAAERELLGSILLRNELFYCGADGLEPDWFSSSLYRVLFAEIKRLLAAGQEANTFTVLEGLEQAGLLQSGDVAALAEVTSLVVCRPAAVEAAAKRVREAARRQHFLATVEAATAEQFDSSMALDDTIGNMQDRLLGFDSPAAQQAECTSAEAVKAMLIEIAARQATGQRVGLPTGLSGLDQLTGGGWRPGEYNIVAGWTGQGKSAFALGAALAALRAGAGVAYFSLEMSREELAGRLLAKLTRTNYALLQDAAHLRQEKQEELALSLKQFPFLERLYFDDRGALTVQELELAARRMIVRHQVGLVVVDYLQLLHVDGEREPRLRVNAISGGLRELAKSTQVPVLAVSQLSRPRDVNEAPTIYHLKESGNLEQDAHRVLLLHRPLEDGHYSGEDYVLLGKNRTGMTGRVEAVFVGGYVSWEERA